jgi:hypothetical protein
MGKKTERNMGRDPLLKNDFFNIINLFYKKWAQENYWSTYFNYPKMY